MPVVAAYPNTIPSFTTKADDIDTVFADHVNILQAEVAAIATALGTQPASTYGTVKGRIAAVEASAAAVAARFDSSGLIPQAGVVGLPAALAAVMNLALVDAKGDLLPGSADNTVVRLPVGATNTVLTSDPTAAGGMSWQGQHMPMHFYFAGALTAGYKPPVFITPAPLTLRLGWARCNTGTGATYGVAINGAMVTPVSPIVGTAVSLFDFTDWALNVGDYVQIQIYDVGSASDLSITLDAILR